MSRLELAAWLIAACSVVVAAAHVVMCRWAASDRRRRPLSWAVAGCMALVTFSLAGAGVFLTGGRSMAAKIAAEEKAEAAFARQRTGDFKAALDLYLEADRMGADPRRALYRAAECCLYMKDYDRSLDLCDALAARVANCGAAHHVRGLVFEARGDFRKAREQWEIAASYNFAPARLKLGKV